MDLHLYAPRLQTYLQPLAQLFDARIVLYDKGGKVVTAVGEDAAIPERRLLSGPVGQVLKGGVALGIDRGGGHQQCAKCPEASACGLQVELLCPVNHDGQTVAAVGLLSSKPSAEQHWLPQRAAVIGLLRQVAESIAGWLLLQTFPPQIQRLREQFQVLLEDRGRPVVVVDPDLRLLTRNEEAAALLSHPGDRPGDPLVEFPPEAAARLRAGRPLRGVTWGRLLVDAHPVRVAEEPAGAILYLQEAAKAGKVQSARRFLLADIRGASPAFARVKAQAQRVAQTDVNVLILGESGTGKELFARAIHWESARSRGPFITVNCAAIPDHLLESELFGYEDGSFTGARRGGRIGRIEAAAGGTLFLDEVGELPLHLQAKLLRVLQFKEVERVGSNVPVPVDYRLITATNRRLEELISQGQFREDLYYRLNVIPLMIPALRERLDDLYMLLEFFGKRLSRQIGSPAHRWSAEAQNVLYQYHWPGNVRELENAMEYAYHMETGEIIGLESLPERIRAAVQSPAVSPGPAPVPAIAPYLNAPPPQRESPAGPPTAAVPPATGEKPPSAPGPRPLSDQDAQRIRAALADHGNTTAGKEAAARALGISRASLYRKLKQISHG